VRYDKVLPGDALVAYMPRGLGLNIIRPTKLVLTVKLLHERIEMLICEAGCITKWNISGDSITMFGVIRN
jgi:hypothetical protein